MFWSSDPELANPDKSTVSEFPFSIPMVRLFVILSNEDLNVLVVSS